MEGGAYPQTRCTEETSHQVQLSLAAGEYTVKAAGYADPHPLVIQEPGSFDRQSEGEFHE